jgi:hypothetical protein
MGKVWRTVLVVGALLPAIVAMCGCVVLDLG